MYINLGIGIPTLIPRYLSEDIKVNLHTENGAIGIGDYPTPGFHDPDLINAGKVKFKIVNYINYIKLH